MIPEAREVVGEDYDTALAGLTDSITNMQRLLAGVWMLQFPDTRFMKDAARTLRRQLGSAAVEVNIITKDEQLTIVAEPGRTSVTVTPLQESLCVLVAGTSQPLQVSDLRHDALVPKKIRSGRWSSWCSVPLKVNGLVIGAVCGLEEKKPRVWSELDEALLNQTAIQIGARVDEWAHENGLVNAEGD